MTIAATEPIGGPNPARVPRMRACPSDMCYFW